MFLCQRTFDTKSSIESNIRTFWVKNKRSWGNFSAKFFTIVKYICIY